MRSDVLDIFQADDAPEVPSWLRQLIWRMHEEIRKAVRDELSSKDQAVLSSESGIGAGDVSYHIDVRPERIVERSFKDPPAAVVVICEGLGRLVFPSSAQEQDAEWCVIVDPLDGSREIAYSKRSAWILSGVAPVRPVPTLADIAWALQTEVPPLTQTTSVMLTSGSGHQAEMQTCSLTSLTTGAFVPTDRALRPSEASSVRGGFAIFADYFAGSHALTGRIADWVFDKVLGKVHPGEAQVFNDQYLSSAGCLYLLASGKYRFFADIRPAIDLAASQIDRNVGLCAHPYDLCTHTIAQQAGVILTDLQGSPLSYALATDIDCGWIGYANESIRSEMESIVLEAIAQITSGSSHA
jgi:fructose-1,6-bisphosphatase/inositol monophosphatase family enzyme